MADGLIAEIQRDALDHSAQVASLLRKVKLAAAKLQLPSLEEWVEHELKGYECDGDRLPLYRQCHGQLKLWNPYHGWQPVGGDVETLSAMSKVFFWEPISVLEGLKGGNPHYPFSPEKLALLSKVTSSQISRAGVDIPAGAITRAVEAVRNLALDWAIGMEKAGVNGEGLSFSPTEKQNAQSATNVFNIGSIGNVTGNLGVGNFSGDITHTLLDIERVEKLVSQIKSNAKTLIKEGVSESELNKAIALLEKQMATKNPSLVRKGLTEIKNVMVEAADGLVAHGVVALLNQILGTGVPL